MLIAKFRAVIRKDLICLKGIVFLHVARNEQLRGYEIVWRLRGVDFSPIVTTSKVVIRIRTCVIVFRPVILLVKSIVLSALDVLQFS